MGKVKHAVRAKSLGFGAIAVFVLATIAFAGAQFGQKPIIAAETPDGETKTVIVQFKNVSAVTSEATAERQRDVIEKVDNEIANATPYAAGFKEKVQSYNNLPFAVYNVDAAGEAALKADENIAAVSEQQLYKPALHRAIPTIGGNVTTGFSDGSSNYTGEGTAVAILDTGVRKSHSMFEGRVVAEACFGTNATQGGATYSSLCPGGVSSSTANGSASYCNDTEVEACAHGTHVASIAAGGTISATVGGQPATLSGVASGADIIAVQVFSRVESTLYCGVGNSPCALATGQAVLAGLDYVIDLAEGNQLGSNIAAVNLSLGSNPIYGTQAQCDSGSDFASMLRPAVVSLKNLNVATIMATGNDGDEAEAYNNIGEPACMEEAVAVSATNLAGNAMAYYANNGALTDLLAPGGDCLADGCMYAAGIASDTATVGYQGTSMATPMVAGAFAVLREKHPNASVDSLLGVLQTTGTPVNDNRSGYTVGSKPRIRLANALAANDVPVISSFAGPSGTVNEGTTMALTASVAGATSCSLNNGVGNVAITGGAISVNVPAAASYVLTCVNAFGDVDTETVNVTLNTAPSVPALSAQNYDAAARTLTLSWNASNDANGIQEYRVYLNGQLVATLPAGAASYTFTNIQPNAAYTAEVRAVDTLGAVSTAASVTLNNGELGTGAVVAAPSVPNTGVQALLGNGRAVLVALLGLAAVIALVVFVTRKARQ